jgi:hypothetical protein
MTKTLAKNDQKLLKDLIAQMVDIFEKLPTEENYN